VRFDRRRSKHSANWHATLDCVTRAGRKTLVKGMARYALPLKTLGDSLFMRNRAIVRLEQAELQPDPESRRWLTSFVVIGGGFSGVEVAGGSPTSCTQASATTRPSETFACSSFIVATACCPSSRRRSANSPNARCATNESTCA
jgi:hypothetical protein